MNAALLRLSASLLLAASITAHAQTPYRVTELPLLPGSASCIATAINAAGDVVGHCAPAQQDFNQTAVRWRGDSVTSLGKLAGGRYSMATAINNAGTIAGDGDTGNICPQGWVSVAGGAPLNFFPNNGGNTHVLFVSESGVIGGYYTKSLSGNTASWKGALWLPDARDPRKYRTQDLPLLPGGVDPKSSTSIPMAFNAAGQAAGYAMNDQIGQHAALWNADASHSVVDLGTWPGDWSSVANAINDLGHVVGSSHPPFGSRAMVWSNDAAHTPYALPPLPGDNQARATGINNLGHVLGASWYGTPGSWNATPERLALWRDGGAWELQALLEPASAAGLELRAANAIGASGHIVGAALRAGQLRAVVLTPLY